MLLCVFLGSTQYIFRTSVARYSLFVLKVPLYTKQTNKPIPPPPPKFPGKTGGGLSLIRDDYGKIG